MYEIVKEFTFEAAHHLADNFLPGHPQARLHGNSFRVEVFLKGKPERDRQWVIDFAEVERQLLRLRGELDHQYLNEIEGLERPTVENISRWIWFRLHGVLPGLDRVLVRRGASGEGCAYRAKLPAEAALG